MTQLNDSLLNTRAEVASACAKVAEVVILLRMDESNLFNMFDETVIGRIDGLQQRHEPPQFLLQLEAFAHGCMEAHLHRIKVDHCEFVYRVTKRKGPGDTVMLLDQPKCYGVKVPLAGRDGIKHYSRMRHEDRASAVCGFAWKDTEGQLDFSSFGPDMALAKFL